jgi:hypothetical protein
MVRSTTSRAGPARLTVAPSAWEAAVEPHWARSTVRVRGAYTAVLIGWAASTLPAQARDTMAPAPVTSSTRMRSAPTVSTSPTPARWGGGDQQHVGGRLDQRHSERLPGGQLRPPRDGEPFTANLEQRAGGYPGRVVHRQRGGAGADRPVQGGGRRCGLARPERARQRQRGPERAVQVQVGVGLAALRRARGLRAQPVVGGRGAVHGHRGQRGGLGAPVQRHPEGGQCPIRAARLGQHQVPRADGGWK